MSGLLASILLCVFCGSVAGLYSVKDYAVHFPRNEVTDYVSIWGMPYNLTEFTGCFWTKSNDGRSALAIVSYAIEGVSKDNHFIIEGNNDFRLVVGNAIRTMHQSISDGKWHHVCASWRSSDGAWEFYKDGVSRAHGVNFRKGFTIRAGGSLVLGQEQDSLGGGFEASQSFKGSLANVNIWSYILPASKIVRMSKSCLSGEGDVYKWSDFRDGIKGGATIVIPSPCQPLSTRG